MPAKYDAEEKFGGSSGFVSVEPQCAKCARRGKQDPFVCQAYPDGIPIEILTNQINHQKAHAGDRGLRFVARSGR